MKLYCGPLSLYSRKVEIALREKDLAYERIMVPFSQSRGYHPKHPDVVAANPKNQVPVLQHGELVVYDSTVILEYIEEAFPTPKLMPSDPPTRARCRQFELFADEIMIVPIRSLMHRTEPHDPDSADWKERERLALEGEAILTSLLAELATKLGANPYFCGDFSLADIALFMPVHYNLRLAGASVAAFPGLAKWYSGLLKRPSFAGIAHEISAADRELSAPVKGAYGTRLRP